VRRFVALGVAGVLSLACSGAEVDEVRPQSSTTLALTQTEPNGWPDSFRDPLVSDCEEIVAVLIEEIDRFGDYFDEVNLTPSAACLCALNGMEKNYTPDEIYEAVDERRSEVVSIWTEGIMGCVLA